MTIESYRLHLLELAQRHGLEILISDIAPAHFAASMPTVRRLFIPDVNTDVNYAVALHEMGHIVAEGGSQGVGPFEAKSIEDWHDIYNSEIVAWAWAERNALEWTTGMEQARQICCSSYLMRIAKERAA